MGRVLGVGVWGNKCKPKPSPTSGTGWDGQEGMEQEDEKAGAEQEQRPCWDILTGSKAVFQRARA